ncbi:aldo/keto reductase [Metabacillus sp. GX 13764]|uniref:aldo/keto reductase n=1 Tax=Metabacillus kandeliae TaxID=2900151 RepID=UPI001E40061D|nr:aldo/keto reductase [Metabacillus kandeliae]MCD7033548.1 aldo/keto reductase [Metabacillus kandeliae]
MEMTSISNTDITASRIALGTWAIGGDMWGGTDEKRSCETVMEALELGINILDTAPAYGKGKSEEIVGRALNQCGDRSKVIVSTKTALDWNKEGDVYRNAARECIENGLDQSLDRLKTDYIDIYHIHWPDPETPIEETALAIKSLLDSGKIRSIGVSNFSVDQIEEFRKYAPLHVVQPPYNLFERDIEKNILPYTKENGITTLLYGSLCRGFLSGKMSKSRKFKGDDLRNNDPKFQGDRFEQYLKAAEELDQYAKNNFNKRIIHLALRWILDQPGADIALWGARKPNQLDPVKDMMDWELDDTAKKDIDSILEKNIQNPVGPEFMAPPTKSKVHS